MTECVYEFLINYIGSHAVMVFVDGGSFFGKAMHVEVILVDQ